MADIKTLQDKVDNLKTLIERDSITPVSLGTLLDYFIEVIAGIRSTLESSDSNIISQITDLSTELTAKATRLEEGYKSADEGLSARITTNANNIAANAATIATHTEELSDLTAECRSLEEAFHSADEQLQKGIDANKASIAKNAADITNLSTDLTAATRSLEEGYKSADEVLQKGIDANAVSITSLSNTLTDEAATRQDTDTALAKRASALEATEILKFAGIYNIADFIADPRSQEAEAALEQVVFYADLHRFDVLAGWDDTTPVFKARTEWDYGRYNQGVGDAASPLSKWYQCSNRLYYGKGKTLVNDSARLDATISELETLGDTVDQNFEECDAALRKAMASLVPTGLTVGELPRLTLGNLEPVYLTAKLEPETVAQNIIYITDNQVVSVAPNGKITMIAPGHAEIHVIPTLNTALAKSVAVEVVEPTVMGVSIAATSGDEGDEEGATSEMRLLSDDTIRFN